MPTPTPTLTPTLTRTLTLTLTLARTRFEQKKDLKGAIQKLEASIASDKELLDAKAAEQAKAEAAAAKLREQVTRSPNPTPTPKPEPEPKLRSPELAGASVVPRPGLRSN